ncbi:hypothetical protein N431DRAFT_334825, partial [Stipitochalara longipes BDJ]
APNRNFSSGGCGDMIFPSNPPSYQGLLTLNEIPQSVSLLLTCMHFVRTNDTEGNAWFYYEDAIHDPAHITYHEAAATQIWPTLLLHLPIEVGSYSTQMSCLRATNATAGFQPITGVSGAASHLQVPPPGEWYLLQLWRHCSYEGMVTHNSLYHLTISNLISGS